MSTTAHVEGESAHRGDEDRDWPPTACDDGGLQRGQSACVLRHGSELAGVCVRAGVWDRAPAGSAGWGRAPKEMLHTRRLRADVLLKLDALVHVCRQIGMNLQMKLRFCCSICDV